MVLILCASFSSQAIAQAVDICEDVEQTRQEKISQVNDTIDKEHDTLDEARDALRECQINLNTQMSSIVGAGGLSDLLKGVSEKLSKKACDEIKKKAEEAARKVEQVAKDKINQAAGAIKDVGSKVGINDVTDLAKDAYSNSSLPDLPTTMSGQSQGSTKSTWDDLGKLLY